MDSAVCSCRGFHGVAALLAVALLDAPKMRIEAARTRQQFIMRARLLFILLFLLLVPTLPILAQLPTSSAPTTSQPATAPDQGPDQGAPVPAAGAPAAAAAPPFIDDGPGPMLIIFLVFMIIVVILYALRQIYRLMTETLLSTNANLQPSELNQILGMKKPYEQIEQEYQDVSKTCSICLVEF